MATGMMPAIQPNPPGTPGPSWLPQPGQPGMPPAQPQQQGWQQQPQFQQQPQYQQQAPQQQQPWQGPTPGWSPPTVPPQQLQLPQDYGAGYPPSMLPPPPGQQQRPQGPFAAQPYQAPLPQQPGQPPQQAGPWGAQPYQPQQQPQQQQGQGQAINPNTVLSGPGVPAELQGRTFGEALSTYNGLRNLYMQQLSSPPPLPPATVPQTQPHQQQPQQQGQQPQQQQWDWRNPQQAIRGVVEQAIQETVLPALAPIHQQNMIQGINGARAQVAQELGVQNFSQLEPDILGMLQGVDPRALVNPQTWRVAAASALGFRQMRGSAQAAPQQNGYAPQQPGYGQQPVPNLNSFFTERPGSTARQDSQPQQLTPMEIYVAQQMGKTPQDYMAWKGGIAR